MQALEQLREQNLDIILHYHRLQKEGNSQGNFLWVQTGPIYHQQTLPTNILRFHNCKVKEGRKLSTGGMLLCILMQLTLTCLRRYSLGS